MPVLQDLRALNLANAQVNLWTVKGPSRLLKKPMTGAALA